MRLLCVCERCTQSMGTCLPWPILTKGAHCHTGHSNRNELKDVVCSDVVNRLFALSGV